jgi:hypothetical protein
VTGPVTFEGAFSSSVTFVTVRVDSGAN